MLRDYPADETVRGLVQRVVGGDEDLVDPAAGPALRQQFAGQVRVAEGQGSVRRDELNLLTQCLIPGAARPGQ